jgi:hypothetical protein
VLASPEAAAPPLLPDPAPPPPLPCTQWDAVSRELAAALGSAQRPALTCLQRYQQLAAVAAKDARQFEAGEGVARLAELVAQHGSSWKVGGDAMCGWCWRGQQGGLGWLLAGCCPAEASIGLTLPAQSTKLPLPSPPPHPHPTPLQRIAEAFGGGWEAEQLMHIWRRHAQRGPVARKGKWSKEEDETLLQVRGRGAVRQRSCRRPAPPPLGVSCSQHPPALLLCDCTACPTAPAPALGPFRPWLFTGASGPWWRGWCRGAPTCSAGSGT